MKSNRNLTIILAAGGTGGHIFPAEALAAELISRGHTPYLITDKRQENYSLSDKNTYVVCSKNASSGRIKAIIALFIGTTQSFKLLRKIKPDVVVGFGGYPSLPTMLAAFILNIHTVIHEQNSVLGRVNRLMATMSDKIATSFANISHIDAKDAHKIVFTGNPVRNYIKAVRALSYPQLTQDEHLHIVVTGGSQGATIFSQVIPTAIISLPDELKKRIRIDQQCRAEDIEQVRKIYNAAGINADLATFFSDIGTRIASAHLLICRAGASTIAEITVAGRAAILVPYPSAKDDHQTSNAKAIADKNAAFMIPQDIFQASLVAEYIKDFILKPDVLSKTAINAFEIGLPDADKKLADLVEEVVIST